MSPARGIAMPRPTAAAAPAFSELVRDDPAVTARPMFGNPAAVVNGNMFTGLFGDDLFVRLSDDDATRLHAAGGADFAPMAGRPMQGYTTLPQPWQSDVESARRWLTISLEWARSLPAKAPRTAGEPRRKR
jgi:TfoX/Sxy family transcriptional regulator of competence genes